MKKKKIFLSAGEVSGDIHGAYLAEKLYQNSDNIELIGIGGENMKKSGVKILDDLTKKNSVGIIEGIPHLFGNFLSLLKAKKVIKKINPDIVVFIDNQGFNLNLSKTVKKQGIYSFYYFAPQLWLWGKKKKSKITKNIDHILATFKKEYKFYKHADINIDYIGHPLLEELKVNQKKEKAFERLNINPQKKVIGLFPGSRKQEFKKLFPKFLEVAKRLKNKYLFLMPFSSSYYYDKYNEKTPNFIKTFKNKSQEILKASDLVLMSSGTATLEAAIYETPMIITYKVSKITEIIAKQLVKIDYIGMPNILLEEEVVPELIQKDFKVDKIIETIEKFMNNNFYYEETIKKLKRVKKMLNPKNAVQKAAKIIIERCNYE